jgi:uncharacterized protein (TIGR03792 family)
MRSKLRGNVGQGQAARRSVGSTVSRSHFDQTGEVVIEELQFVVDPAERDEFVVHEGAIWTEFLKTCDGFVDKDVWYPQDDPGRVIVMIWWNTLEQWKQITPAQCDEVDARMGRWLRPIDVARTHHVVRSTLAH